MMAGANRRKAACTGLIACTLGSVLIGCGKDQCDHLGERRCSGSEIIQCEHHGAHEPGDVSFNHWSSSLCTSVYLDPQVTFCATLSSGPTCVETAEPDPRCVTSPSSVCDDGAPGPGDEYALTCTEGFVTERIWCTYGCDTTDEGARCREPSPCLVDARIRCVDADASAPDSGPSDVDASL